MADKSALFMGFASFDLPGNAGSVEPSVRLLFMASDYLLKTALVLQLTVLHCFCFRFQCMDNSKHARKRHVFNLI